MDTCLNELIQAVRSKFTYVYDFGDSWEHIIRLEKILPEEEDKTYPLCVGGERACPPEDCGGIWRYQEMLDILADKNHDEYDEATSWLGEDWDAEHFDSDQANAALQDYAQQWEDIYNEEDDEDGWDAGDYEDEGFNEFDKLSRFSAPEDVLTDELEASEMKGWIEEALDDTKTPDYQAYKRLCDLGFDKEKTADLIMRTLSIEWFYDLKYGTDHLEDRYKYNLHHLPENPQELPRLNDALEVLDRCMKGVPFAAIEYVQNDRSDTATSSVLNALRNHSDHQYCWADCTTAPFWYALAAEGHLCEEMIDPVVRLYEKNHNESGWLHDQGQFLIGKLAQKYPDLTVDKVLEAMERDTNDGSIPYVYYLFDAFHFCDVDKYKDRLLTFLEHDSCSWYEMLAGIIADLKIIEALPLLKISWKSSAPIMPKMI